MVQKRVNDFINDIRYRIQVIRLNKGLKYRDIENSINLDMRSFFYDGYNSTNIRLVNLFNIFNALGYDVDYEIIKDRIIGYFKSTRLTKNITQVKLSEASTLSRKTIYDFLYEKTSLTFEVYAKICVGLDVDFYEPYDFKILELILPEEDIRRVDYKGSPEFNLEYLNIEWRQPNSCYIVKDVEVIDGDTIRALTDQNRRIRMSTINTPESSKKKEKFGITAKQFVQTLVDKYPDNIIIQLDDSSRVLDRFGRYIGHVWLYIDNKYVLLDYLVSRAGLCEIKHIYKDDSIYYKYFVKANKYAVNNKLLMYNPNCEDPNWDYCKDTHKYTRIGIKVVTKNNKILYALPSNYFLTEFEYLETPTEFRSDLDAKLALRNIKLEGDLISKEIVFF